MPNLPRNLNSLVLLAISPLLASSCSDRDPLVDELVRSQERQHETVARQSEALTQASRELVTADSKSRQEQAEHHSKLQSQLELQRENLDAQRDALEAERREIATQRHRDPLLATALIQAVTLFVSALPIVLLIFLIRAARQESADVSLGDLLVQDLTSETPLLLPAPLIERHATLLPPPQPSALSGDQAEDNEENPSPNPSF